NNKIKNFDTFIDSITLHFENNIFSNGQFFSWVDDYVKDTKNMILPIFLFLVYLIGIIFSYTFIEEIVLDHGGFIVGEALFTILETILNPEIFPPILLLFLIFLIGPILSITIFLLFVNNYFPFFMSLLWPISLPIFILFNAGLIHENLMQNLIGSISLIGFVLFYYLLSITSLIVNSINILILLIITLILKIFEKNIQPVLSICRLALQ
ncbi:MAG: hypothetical protein QCI00_09740, partial [Candidatus Thermoplasmatota archaeon]|nr:hypothetical protein [Candidatus Thermoplasmatota archaeon]